MVLAKNMSFMLSIQMVTPHLVHLKKIRSKHKIITKLLSNLLIKNQPTESMADKRPKRDY